MLKRHENGVIQYFNFAVLTFVFYIQMRSIRSSSSTTTTAAAAVGGGERSSGVDADSNHKVPF